MGNSLLRSLLVVALIQIAAAAQTKPAVDEAEQNLQAALAASKTGKHQDAIKFFALAASKAPDRPGIWVAYGDELNELSRTDVEYMRRARAAWDQALVLDPQNRPALQRVFHFWSELADLEPTRLEVFASIREVAAKLHALDPTDAAAEIAIETSVLRPWLGGAQADEPHVKATLDKLQKLSQKYPDNADIVLYTAQAKLKLGDAAAAREIVEAGIKRTPSASMYFSAAQVMSAMAAAEPAKARQWKSLEREYFTKAMEAAKPEDPLYPYIGIAAARANGADRGAAEAILRKLQTARPDDQQVRLALAEHLAIDRAKRDEALAILDLPLGTWGLTGPRAYLVRELQLRTLATATNLRLDQSASMAPEARPATMEKINDSIGLIELREGETARVLRLRGKLLRAQGKTIDAIRLLEKARAMGEQSHDAAGRLDHWEVIDLLGRLYIETNQTGRAKELLKQLIAHFPGYDPGRIILAQLLLRENQFDEARPHVDYLKQHRPDDPETIKLQLQLSKGEAGPR